MKLFRTMLGIAVAGSLLTGCTLTQTLAGAGDAPTTLPTTTAEGETGTETAGATTPPVSDPTGTEPVETVVAPPQESGAPDRVNVQLELGVPHDILGKNGEVVGTITVTGVQNNATCTNPVADGNKNGKFVIANFELTATDALRDQDDPWYGRNFDLSTIDVIDPYTGLSVKGGLDYDCLPSADRLSTVQPGRTQTGALAYDVADVLFTIGWFYGHQYYYIPPSVWEQN